MQNEPEKVSGNYNEIHSVQPAAALQPGLFRILRAEEQNPTEPEDVIRTGLGLIHAKINEILGDGNKLAREDLGFPEVRFIATLPEHPNFAGYFAPDSNEIVIVLDKARDFLSRTKVFSHEFFHFLSHNGRDDDERIDSNSPITQKNNIGFRRDFGFDIRAGKEGETTSDYFVAFNEAVTEQLAIDILPEAYQTYKDYRGLLNQVLDDAVTRQLGSQNEDGTFQMWTRDQFKDYIYKCFFKGDLSGFTGLLKEIYKAYDISEQQFGLMTHKDDLPSVIAAEWTSNNPDSPPPSPSQIAAAVQLRLDSKTPDDYVTDIIGPEPGEGGGNGEDKYGAEYDAFVKENGIVKSHTETIDGREFEVDNLGFFIFKGDEAASILAVVKEELDDLLVKFKSQEITVAEITERMDTMLFEQYYISMLSDGFRDFYIDKHAKIDQLG